MLLSYIFVFHLNTYSFREIIIIFVFKQTFYGIVSEKKLMKTDKRSIFSSTVNGVNFN